MDKNEVARRLLPASRYKNFPALKHRLKGHWGIYRDSSYNPGTRENDESLGMARIEYKRGDVVKVGHKRVKPHRVWVVPDCVPLDEHWPHSEWLNTPEHLDKSEAVKVLAAAFEAVGAPPWLDEEQTDDA